jgi:hypothetical protein
MAAVQQQQQQQQQQASWQLLKQQQQHQEHSDHKGQCARSSTHRPSHVVYTLQLQPLVTCKPGSRQQQHHYSLCPVCC